MQKLLVEATIRMQSNINKKFVEVEFNHPDSAKAFCNLLFAHFSISDTNNTDKSRKVLLSEIDKGKLWVLLTHDEYQCVIKNDNTCISNLTM